MQKTSFISNSKPEDSSAELKRFVFRGVIFLLPLLLMFGALEFKLTRVSNSYMRRSSFLEAVASDVKVLVTGNSYASYGIRPALFSQKGFNMASVSQTLMIDSQFVEKYVGELPKLKMVVMQFAYFSMGTRLSDSPEYWRNFFYSYYYGIPGDGGISDRFDFRRWSIFLALGPGTARDYLSRPPGFAWGEELDETGWFRKSDHTNLAAMTPEHARFRVSGHDSMYRGDSLLKNIAAIKKAVIAARAKDVKIIFIMMPASQAYVQSLMPLKLQESVQRIHFLASELNVPFKIYLEDARFEMGDFYDCDHLNSKGAAKFSQILDQEVLVPELGR